MSKSIHAAPGRSESSARNSAPSNLSGAFSSLIADLQRAVAAAGYNTPTPIQEQCITPLLEKRDLIGTAQTGTGKTAAFALPLLQLLAKHKRRPQRNSPRALILAPTRELAAQIGDSMNTYGRFLRLSHTVVYGGVKQFGQVKDLNRGVDILIATPGRLLDLMRQGHIQLDEIEIFVLDEVDRMLDMGFMPDIEQVLAKMPAERQTLFFSATMAPKMEKLADTMVNNPVKVTIEPQQRTVEKINQKVLFVGKGNKTKLLCSLLNEHQISKALVFTQMKHAANKLVDKLQAAGFRGTAIHGNKSQAARNRALDGFKRGKFQVMVATDVAARGLDVDDITHVINYDLPVEAETYIHRIGRTARAGAEGDAISFCCAEDRSYLRDIERLLGDSIQADMEHDYHCEDAFRSTAPAPANFGRGGGGNRRGRSGRPGGNARSSGRNQKSNRRYAKNRGPSGRN